MRTNNIMNHVRLLWIEQIAQYSYNSFTKKNNKNAKIKKIKMENTILASFLRKCFHKYLAVV